MIALYEPAGMKSPMRSSWFACDLLELGVGVEAEAHLDAADCAASRRQ